MDKLKAEALEKCANILAEHFDCVQIVASELNPNVSTSSIHRGSGNWFARRALCQEFVELDQADMMARSLGREIKKEG